MGPIAFLLFFSGWAHEKNFCPVVFVCDRGMPGRVGGTGVRHAAAGIPYVFQKWTVQKTEASENEKGIGHVEIKKKSLLPLNRELVLDEDLVEFN